MPPKYNAAEDPMKVITRSDPSRPPQELLNYKPILRKFVEANEAFLDCMRDIPKDSISSMSQGQLDSAC